MMGVCKRIFLHNFICIYPSRSSSPLSPTPLAHPPTIPDKGKRDGKISADLQVDLDSYRYSEGSPVARSVMGGNGFNVYKMK